MNVYTEIISVKIQKRIFEYTVQFTTVNIKDKSVVKKTLLLQHRRASCRQNLLS